MATGVAEIHVAGVALAGDIERLPVSHDGGRVRGHELGPPEK